MNIDLVALLRYLDEKGFSIYQIVEIVSISANVLTIWRLRLLEGKFSRCQTELKQTTSALTKILNNIQLTQPSSIHAGQNVIIAQGDAKNDQSRGSE